jgi:hypothetical protein
MLAILALLASLSAANDEFPIEKKLPVLANPLPRQPKEGDIVTSYGTILDPSCKDMSANLEKAIGRALEFNSQCAERIPYTGFPGSVDTILKQAVIICADWRTDPTFFTPGQLAYSPAFGIDKLGSKRAREEAAAAAPAFAKRLPDYDATQTSWYAHLYFIVLLKALAAGDVEPLSTILWHETMHHTGMNSRGDHGIIEAVAPDPDKLCAENALDDRIVMLQAACRLPKEKGHGELLLRRIEQCGIERACLRPLTDVRPPSGPLFDPASVRRSYLTYYGDHPKEAALVCKEIRASLAQQARDREIPDPHAFDRFKLAADYILSHAGGMAAGVPPYYYAPLNNDQRRALSQVKDLDLRIADLCGQLDGETDFRGAKGRVLYSVQLQNVNPECPFSTQSDLHDLTIPLAGFHGAEAELQSKTMRVMDELAMYILSAKFQPAEIEGALKRVYDEACPDGAAFRPQLCDNGRQVVQAAIDEARARFEPNSD